jgi:hypothetical protein
MRDMVILARVFAIVGAIFGITVTVIGERQSRVEASRAFVTRR